MRAPISKAVLLVGGEGTRLRPLTYHRPKALIPLINQPLLSYEFSLLARHGITDVVLAVGYKADALREALGDGSAWGVNLTYVEDPAPLGTAGAIKNVQRYLDEPFVAMNGDLVYEVNVGAMTQAHLAAGATITFCLRRVRDISRYGLIQRDEAGWVTAFKEKQTVDETGQNTVNGGLYVMSPEVFEHIPPDQECSNELELFPGLLAAGKPLLGFVPEDQGYWADVGTLESYLQTSRDLLAGAISWVDPAIAPTAHISESATIRPPVCIADDVTIEANATVGPNVAVGKSCRIASRARLENSILWDDVTVGQAAQLVDTVVSDGVGVPAGAHHHGEAVAP